MSQPDWHRRTPEELKAIALYAKRTSNAAAQRKFTTSEVCVRRAMKLHGFKPHPPGCPKQNKK